MKLYSVIPVVVASVFSSGGLIAAPANDNFSGAEVLSENIAQVDADTTGASREVGEEDGSIDDLTVWYTWTAPRKGDLKVSGYCADTDFSLYIYRLSGTPNILNLSRLKYDYTYGSTINFSSMRVAGGSQFYFRVGSNAARVSQLLLNFTPVYESAVSISTNSVLKKKKRITGQVAVPGDVANIRVTGGRFGQVKQVSYNPSTGAFSFLHVRKGSAPKNGKFRKVTYTVEAYMSGSKVGATAKTFRVKY